MKVLTCRDVGGACEATLRGETLEEIGELAREHALAADDEAHRAKMEEMRNKTDEEKGDFWRDMQEKFASAPDVGTED